MEDIEEKMLAIMKVVDSNTKLIAMTTETMEVMLKTIEELTDKLSIKP